MPISAKSTTWSIVYAMTVGKLISTSAGSRRPQNTAEPNIDGV